MLLSTDARSRGQWQTGISQDARSARVWFRGAHGNSGGRIWGEEAIYEQTRPEGEVQVGLLWSHDILACENLLIGIIYNNFYRTINLIIIVIIINYTHVDTHIIFISQSTFCFGKYFLLPLKFRLDWDQGI